MAASGAAGPAMGGPPPDQQLFSDIDQMFQLFGAKRTGLGQALPSSSYANNGVQGMSQAQYEAYLNAQQGIASTSSAGIPVAAAAPAPRPPAQEPVVTITTVPVQDDDTGSVASVVPFPRSHSLAVTGGVAPLPSHPPAVVPAGASVGTRSASISPQPLTQGTIPPMPMPGSQTANGGQMMPGMPPPAVAAPPDGAAPGRALVPAAEERARKFEERAAYLRATYGIDTDDEASSVAMLPKPTVAAAAQAGTSVNQSQQTLLGPNGFQDPGGYSPAESPMVQFPARASSLNRGPSDISLPLPPLPDQGPNDKALPPSPQPSSVQDGSGLQQDKAARVASLMQAAQVLFQQPPYAGDPEPTGQAASVASSTQPPQQQQQQRGRPTMQGAAAAVVATQYFAGGPSRSTATSSVQQVASGPSSTASYEPPVSATPSQIAQLEQLTLLLQEKERQIADQQRQIAAMAAQPPAPVPAPAPQPGQQRVTIASAVATAPEPKRPAPIVTNQPRTPATSSDNAIISTHVNGEDIPYVALPMPTQISQARRRPAPSPSQPPAIDPTLHPPDLSFRIRVPDWSSYYPGKRHRVADAEAGGWRWRLTLYPRGRQGCRTGFNCSIEIHCVSYEGDFSDRKSEVEARFQFIVGRTAVVTKQGVVKAGARWGMDTLVEVGSWGYDGSPDEAHGDKEPEVVCTARLWYGPFDFAVPENEGTHPLLELHRYFPAPGGNLADLTLRVGDKSYYVHRMVLGMCSDFFRNLLDFGPSEPLVDQTIVFRSVRPEIIELILDYLYNSNYSLPSGMPWRTLAEVFAASETYQIPHLQQMAVVRLGSMLEPNNIVPLFLLAKKTDNKRLQKMITDYVSNNYEKLKDQKSQLVSTVLKLPEQDASQVRKLLDSLLEAAEKYKTSRGVGGGSASGGAAARTAVNGVSSSSGAGGSSRQQQPMSASGARTNAERIGWSSGNVFSADGPRPGLRPTDGGPPNRAAAARWLGGQTNVTGFS